MHEKRRSIGPLQIYFDESCKARYSWAGKELTAVKRELEAWQEFVEKWLQDVEEPAPMTTDQQRLRGLVENTVALLTGPTLQLSDQVVEGILKTSVSTWHGQFKNLRLEQVESIVVDVVSSL